VNKLLKLARISGGPIIDHQAVTFLWESELVPVLIADFTDWERYPIPLTRVGMKTWTYEVDFPENAYIEYAFLDLQSNKRISDPYYPRSVLNGLGEINHFFYMPDASPNPLTRCAKGIPKGEISHHSISTDEMATGKQRRVYLYPPRTSASCPLGIILDGNDYFLSFNQFMCSLLVEGGYQVKYREYPGGHNYPSWQNDL
jgi:enterochelin esterase-like enzyme